ncbi:hypothetical protein SESBI_04524 [Sesbania bispinosa]|nr:hypothetical protein SESBI_04524 [Sesbania bispinosa]
MCKAESIHFEIPLGPVVTLERCSAHVEERFRTILVAVLGHNSRSCTAPPVDTTDQDGENVDATAIGTQQSQQKRERESNTKLTAGTEERERESNTAGTKLTEGTKERERESNTAGIKLTAGTKHTAGTKLTADTDNEGHKIFTAIKTNQGPRKADTATQKGTSPTEMGAHAHKRGKKKSLPPGPSILEFARHMSVGQLVRHLTAIWDLQQQMGKKMRIRDIKWDIATQMGNQVRQGVAQKAE